MRLDPRTVAAIVASIGLVLLLLTMTAVWWTRHRHPGFGRWTLTTPLLLLSLFLLSLRPNVPHWISMVTGGAVLMVAAILYLEGAREFRGLPPRVWLVYGGGVLALCGLAFFVYIIPSQNGRAAVTSAFVSVILLLASITLLKGNPEAHRFGLGLTGSMFALCGVTNTARALYCSLGPPFNDPFTLSGVHGVFLLGISVQVSLFPLGFMFLADDRVSSDLLEARKRAWRADAASLDTLAQPSTSLSVSWPKRSFPR